jgi:hypothetical protein
MRDGVRLRPPCRAADAVYTTPLPLTPLSGSAGGRHVDFGMLSAAFRF